MLGWQSTSSPSTSANKNVRAFISTREKVLKPECDKDIHVLLQGRPLTKAAIREIDDLREKGVSAAVKLEQKEQKKNK